MKIQQRQLGQTGPLVSMIGLGCMGMSGIYGPADRAESIATIRAALDAGINLIDTGDFYGMGHNEMLIAEAIEGRRNEAILSVKFNALRDPKGAFIGFDARPAAVKSFLAYSLQRLRVEVIDIYRPSRLDPSVPIEDTIGAIADMIKAGYVRHIGLSEVGADTIRRAAAVHPICDVQIEYSLLSRSAEDKILPTCRELGIGVTAYGVLSRGLLSGQYRPPQAGAGVGPAFPRFQPGALEANLQLVERLRSIGEQQGLSVAQLAIAWVAAQGQDLVPVIGAKRRHTLSEAKEAVQSPLSAETLQAIEGAIPKGAAIGDRYPAALMATLDSER